MIDTCTPEPLTEEEKAQAIDLIGRVAALVQANIPMDPEIFEAVMKLVPMIGVEVIVMREHEGRQQVLLVQRPPDDIGWPNQWHCPGTATRCSDKNLDQPDDFIAQIQPEITRLERLEYEVELVNARFLYLNKVIDSVRSLVLQVICTAEIAEEDEPAGTWFDVDDLPADTIREHLPMIAHVAEMRSSN